MATQSSSGPSAEFKLSITRALADQLAVALLGLSPAPLTEEELDKLDKRPGVYELFLDNNKVYIGKASQDLPGRLGNHLRKLSGRTGIRLDQVKFQCLYVDEDLEAAAPEKMLIKNNKDDGTIPWNTNGFGNKDPGRNRDNSLVKANHFDANYPINLDQPFVLPEKLFYSIWEYLQMIKLYFPFNIRYDARLKQRPGPFPNLRIEPPQGRTSARELVKLAIETLPEGWQATALSGYIILYEEIRDYEGARTLWRKIDGVTTELVGAGRLGEPGSVEEDPSNEE